MIMWVKVHDITRDCDVQRYIEDERWRVLNQGDKYETSPTPFSGLLVVDPYGKEIPIMTFSDALTALRDDKIVTRVAWNGGVFLFIRQSEQMAHPTVDGEKLPTQPAIMVKGHHGVVSSFCPTDADLLADDWTLVNV